MLYGHDEGKNIKQLCDGTKDVVCIKMGGTGADTVAGARNNLGLGNTAGALPVANGGTGATNAAAARTNLGITPANLGLTGAETKTLLWENASPSSTFDNHTVEVDLSGYDSIEIEFKFNNASSNCFVSRHRVGVESALIGVTGGPTALYPILRWFNFVTKGVNFFTTTNWNLNADNGICIPFKIYGIKEV